MKSPKRQLADQRLAETIAHLWSRYDKDRTNNELRNRLVEHYTPLVQQIVADYIRRYRLREVETAIGDGLLLLLVRLVPQYDGEHRDFCRWAAKCIRQKMLDRRRLERLNAKRFAKRTDCERHWPEDPGPPRPPRRAGQRCPLRRTGRGPARPRCRRPLAAVLSPHQLREISTTLNVSHYTAASLIRGGIVAREVAAEKSEK